MIKLRNVSKYYYSKGLIASGISKVNLDFDLGEFVVITGESGSGKSTLLNVISGLDSYEEGEMYIQGQETSHYLAADFEEYRKKYIANIFQNHNLINSYTVYQNVEMILLINGYGKSEIQRRAREIIARALAKDTDIIVADEPTGNLDSKSAQGIVRLLSEISRDRLVVVVTHNFEQFEQYATRRVRMHDGKVIENVQLRPTVPVPSGARQRRSGSISPGNRIRLGVRNTFNIFYKFLLLLLVFLFLVFGVASQYTTFLNARYEGEFGYGNPYFMNFSNDRIVVKKQDGAAFTDTDYTVFYDIPNVKSVAPNDILLDTTMYIQNDIIAYETYPHAIDELRGTLTAGRMPEADDEVVIRGEDDGFTLTEDMIDTILDQEFTIFLGDSDKEQINVTVTGILLEKNGAMNSPQGTGEIYLSSDYIQQMLMRTYQAGSTITTQVNGREVESVTGDAFYSIMPSDKVAKGECLVPEEINNYYVNDDGEQESPATGREIKAHVKNMFFEDDLTVKIADTYSDADFTKKTGNEDYDANAGAFFISSADYDSLFGKGNFQCSVYVEDMKDLNETAKAIRGLGYKTLILKETETNEDQGVQDIIRVPITVLIILAIFGIAYLVAGLILRSRISYFSILRMLGMARNHIRHILSTEIFLVMNIAFAIFLLVIFLVNKDVITLSYLETLVNYMGIRDYVILYLLIAFMTLLISVWFSRRLFRKTALETYREEV